METLIETIIEKARTNLVKNNWQCNCADCIFTELKKINDLEMYEIIKNYDTNFLE